MNMYNRDLSWSDHPIAHVASLVAFLLFAVVAVLVGAVLFSFFFGVAAIAGVVLYARLWWLRRKGRRVAARAPARGRIVEAQFEVVQQRDEREQD